MTDWVRHRLIDTLTEVGEYALHPQDEPETLERTYGYYTGWRACIMFLQDRVRSREVSSPEAMDMVLDDAEAVGTFLKHGTVFTHPECHEVDDLSDAALGDVQVRVLTQYSHGWDDAVEMATERLVQVADNVYSQ